MYKNKSLCIIIISIFLMLLTVNYNFSLDVIATASTEESYELTASNAVDGDMSTRWASVFEDDQWLLLDLGKAIELTGIEIHWENAYAGEYKVLLSKNEKNWDEVFSTEDGMGETEEVTFKKQSARYVKILAITRGTEWGNSIFEINFIDSTGKTLSGSGAGAKSKSATHNLSNSVKASASTEEGDDLNAYNAIDGDMNTRWASAAEDDQWLLIDLGENLNLRGVEIYWENAYTKEYKVLVSKNKKSHIMVLLP